MAYDCTERPEIPQPETGWGTWYSSELLIPEAVGNVPHDTL